MEVGLFFLFVFLAYTVLVSVALTRLRGLTKTTDRLQSELKELRGVVVMNGNMVQNMAGQSVQPAQLPNEDMAQLNALLDNPMVRQAMANSDDSEVQELQTLLSNPMVMQALGRDK